MQPTCDNCGGGGGGIDANRALNKRAIETEVQKIELVIVMSFLARIYALCIFAVMFMTLALPFVLAAPLLTLPRQLQQLITDPTSTHHFIFSDMRAESLHILTFFNCRPVALAQDGEPNNGAFVCRLR
jgi:hypothetical protein